jgi:hypothetical protein
MSGGNVFAGVCMFTGDWFWKDGGLPGGGWEAVVVITCC